MENEELVIDEMNFDQYFFDVRTHKPQRGQIIACYTAIAELIDGQLKQDVVNLLNTSKAGAISVPKILRKLAGAVGKDSYRIAKEICQDLIDGMSTKDVLDKPYKYKLELYYYTDPQYLPKDIHWSSIGINNLDEFCDQVEDKHGNKFTIKSKIVKECELNDSEN